MNCPHCAKAVDDGSSECRSCGVIFAKLEKLQAERAAAKVSLAAFPERDSSRKAAGNLGICDPIILELAHARIAWLIAAAVALLYALRFRAYLPITDGWVRFETWLLPLSSLDVVFHEAGHWIFGILGVRFITVAGGTIMQLAMPAACLFHFWKRNSLAGVVAIVFWIGLNLAEISWYAADAKAQVLILITGLSGKEGGGHDWGYMLSALGLTNECIGIGQAFFFSGIAFMAFAPVFCAMKILKSFNEDQK